MSWMIMNSQLISEMGGKSLMEATVIAEKQSFIHNLCFSHRVELVLVVSGYVSKMQIIINHRVLHWLIQHACRSVNHKSSFH